MTEITKDIRITAQSFYQTHDAGGDDVSHFFKYEITIQNNSPFAVKLLRRHWDIKDSGGPAREVDGDGVVGYQPELEPGAAFSYVSGCNFLGEVGLMKGYYTFKNLETNEIVHVNIPPFICQASYILN